MVVVRLYSILPASSTRIVCGILLPSAPIFLFRQRKNFCQSGYLACYRLFNDRRIRSSRTIFTDANPLGNRSVHQTEIARFRSIDTLPILYIASVAIINDTFDRQRHCLLSVAYNCLKFNKVPKTIRDRYMVRSIIRSVRDEKECR